MLLYSEAIILDDAVNMLHIITIFLSCSFNYVLCKERHSSKFYHYYVHKNSRLQGQWSSQPAVSVPRTLGSPCTVSSPCSRSCQCQKLFFITMSPGQQALGCQHFTEITLSMVRVWGKCCQGTFSTHHNWCG